ncbi:3525_t:CDS:10 [Ambispora leptoticha]|uniref:3525_t:CDS:1 n=1 Tax=Ambispora leptoticha TaxID=144679 RepID=A0A9N8YW25_9GLOM|nr:3525_t:CDS:10 [Ambispora leptoticha]
MLTRRRDETSDTNIGSPKRLRVVESEQDAQYNTYCSTLSSANTFSIPPISSVDDPKFVNQEFSSDLVERSSLSMTHGQEELILNKESTLSTQEIHELNKLKILAHNEHNNTIINPDNLTTVANGSTDGEYTSTTTHSLNDHLDDAISDETSSLDEIIDNINHITDEDDEEPTTPETEDSIILNDEERERFKKEAKEKGTHKFVQEFFFENRVPIRKLFSAFDYQLPSKITGLSDTQLLPILHKVITKYLRQRQKLADVNTMDDVVRLLQQSKNIMVLTELAYQVSVSCGIPDFRSENGIYSRLSEFDLDDPQDMFDINYFKDCPEVFYSFAKEIFPSNFKPSTSHCFVKLLEEKGKLLRNYTQNIDTLEQATGIKKVLQCHGSFATASCINCGYKVDGEVIKEDILAKRVPYCSRCRLTNNDEDIENSGSIMKPDIVFFGEKLPPEFDELFPEDREKVDLLIVMGSSLKVAPVSEIMGQIPHRIPQIVINRTPIKHMHFDVQLLGDCDIIIPELCRLLDWEIIHEKLPGGSTKTTPATSYQFVEPNIYLFEGAVVKPGELVGGDVGVCNDNERSVTAEVDDDQVVDVVGQTVVETGGNCLNGSVVSQKRTTYSQKQLIRELSR